jgi:Arc/MetJ-type ribon-helix-helix transcriptional regulator
MPVEQKEKAGVIHGLRINAQLRNRIERAMQKDGFSSRSAFMRAAIERELAGRESGVDEAEQRIAASLERMSRQIQNLRIGQQALFAFVDVLAKTFLTCVPEPPRDVQDQAVARGKARYDRFLKSVGMAMVGDSQAAMAELLGRGQE